MIIENNSLTLSHNFAEVVAKSVNAISNNPLQVSCCMGHYYT